MMPAKTKKKKRTTKQSITFIPDPTMSSVPAELVKEAKALIKSKAHVGNHGFTGESLIAWKKQRKSLLAVLKPVAEKKWPSATVLEAGKNDLQCPRDVEGGMSAGTEDGAEWIKDAIDALRSIDDEKINVLDNFSDQAHDAFEAWLNAIIERLALIIERLAL